MPSKKNVDVARPGKTAPDTSARPVIVTHKPMVEDPMVKKDETKDEPKSDTSSKKVIQPLVVETDKPAEEPKPPEPANDPEKEQAKEAAVVDAVAGQADLSGKKKDGEPTDEELKKQEELDKLIESKKYFVSIGQVAKRRNKRASLAVLALLVVLTSVYLAIDVGLIDVGLELPLEVIKD